MKFWYHSKEAKRVRTVTVRIDCGLASALERFIEEGIPHFRNLAADSQTDSADAAFMEAEVSEMKYFLRELKKWTDPK